MGQLRAAERLNIIAQVPHVGTNASQGVLHGIQGIQDLTLAAKYRFAEVKPARPPSARSGC